MEPPDGPTQVNRVHAGATSPDPGYIPTLDGWRAVAILWVMLHHGQEDLFGPSGPIPSAILHAIADRGASGVSIFFGISGFLICSRLLDERRRTGRIDLADFYLRRTFRILPPYYAYLAVVGLLWAAGVLTIGRLPYLGSVFFVRNYIPETMPVEWFTGHFWSLAVEEHFYLIWPAILVACRTTRAARLAAFGLALAVMAWREVDGKYHILTAWLHLPINDFHERTDFRLDGLLLGCGMALLLDDPRRRERMTRFLSPGVWLVAMAVFAAAVGGILRPVLRQPVISAVVPVLLAGTVLRPGAWPGRVLEWGPLRTVGRLSYSLYIWQQLFLVPATAGRPLGILETFPMNWIAASGCAVVSYRCIERPAIEIGKRLSRLRRGRGLSRA